MSLLVEFLIFSRRR